MSVKQAPPENSNYVSTSLITPATVPLCHWQVHMHPLTQSCHQSKELRTRTVSDEVGILIEERYELYEQWLCAVLFQ